MHRERDWRRWQRQRHLDARLREDRLQHAADRYYPISPNWINQRPEQTNTKYHCACFWDPKAIARFAEQPKRCSCWECGNPRRYAKTERLTMQERRFLAMAKE